MRLMVAAFPLWSRAFPCRLAFSTTLDTSSPGFMLATVIASPTPSLDGSAVSGVLSVEFGEYKPNATDYRRTASGFGARFCGEALAAAEIANRLGVHH